MIEIQPDILLANYFLRNNNAKLTYGDIREISNTLSSELKKRCNKDVYFHIDKGWLTQVVEWYPHLFRWCNSPDFDEIESSDDEYLYNYDEYIRHFNAKLDKEIKEVFIKTFDKIVGKPL